MKPLLPWKMSGYGVAVVVYFHLYSPVLNKSEHKKLSILICKQNHVWYLTQKLQQL